MNTPKLPELSRVEGALLLVLVAVGAYAAYKAYSTGSKIAGSVKDTVSDVGNAIANTWHKAGDAVNDLTHGVKDLPPDQAAEALRQIRNDERKGEASGIGTDSQGTSDGSNVVYDPMMGVVLSTDARTYAQPQTPSPEPFFMGPLTVNGTTTEPEGSF